jgi:hypothetical protein
MLNLPYHLMDLSRRGGTNSVGYGEVPVLFRAVHISSTDVVDHRKFGRIRAYAASLLVAGLLAVSTATSALALTGEGIIIGPWSCGPDQQVGLTFYVTGTGGGYKAGVAYYYNDTHGNWWIVQRNLYAGYTYLSPPLASRTITKFEWSTYGNGNIRSWTKSCS